MKNLLHVFAGLSIVLSVYVFLVSIPKLESKTSILSSKIDRCIDAYNRKDQAYSHPFPLFTNEYSVCEPGNSSPRLIMQSTKWTDGEWKDINIIFFDGNNVCWKFTVLTPFDPNQWLVQRSTDPNTDIWEKIPIRYLNQKLGK